MDAALLLSRVDELPRLPKAISELLDAVNDSQATIKGITSKLAQEPIVSARVLRMANSAYFGSSREVASLDEAVVRLGMQKLRTLVIASALVGAVPASKAVNLGEFWGNTFEVACCCQVVAKSTKSEPDAAFTCAILHNIGELLIATIMADSVHEIEALIDAGGEVENSQIAVLGYSAADIGSLLADNWKFPPALVDGIRFQNHPTKTSPYSELAGLLYFCKQVSHEWDDCEDDERTAWLAGIMVKSGLKVPMDGLAQRLTAVRGQGYEMGKLLA
ncbi:HDOD domain-containing protein [Shewanella sp. NIFS-20-20]|uniref:HDOD domain-containing protein n=1 Tax=Shewanella sp. NIFS-20-20 TaxID=2853806 RepID=UPI001C45AC7F|nr:HDOD domain-containing protein [Shewanella sp. NIFS-20-20]MBV7316677.1 HDOD domain-containing protein [Shewanella sp. NIFS-20-20]